VSTSLAGLLRAARVYHSSWRVIVVPVDADNKPFLRRGLLERYYTVGQSWDSVVELFARAKRARGVSGVAVYPLRRGDRVLATIDFDCVRECGADNASLARFLASRLPDARVVVSRRGVHLHVYTDVFYRGEVSMYGVRIAEVFGAVRHAITMPPTVRGSGDDTVQYKFILPDGGSTPDPGHIDPPGYVGLSELAGELEGMGYNVSIEGVRGATLHTSNRAASSTMVIALDTSTAHSHAGSSGGGRMKDPLFPDIESFRRYVYENPRRLPLPSCIAWGLGVDPIRPGVRVSRVRRGYRFTVGGATAMFIAYVVDRVSREEVLDLVGRNLEGYPDAGGGRRLDRELSNLLLDDGRGGVAPRYAGLGSMASNMPRELCDSCVYRGYCMTGRGVSPWRGYVRALKSIARRRGG